MDLFTEGQKLALFFQKDSNMVEMSCNIETILDDRLNLALPPYFMRYVEYLQVGNAMTAKAFSKFGTVDFNTIVISSPLEDCFTIELDYNSVKLTPGSELPVIDAVEKLEVKSANESFEVRTIELSTDFIKFNCDSKLSVNENIEGILYLPKNYGIIYFKAIISEIDPIYETEYTATYTTMTEQDRQLLLYYMYVYSQNTNQEEI